MIRNLLLAILAFAFLDGCTGNHAETCLDLSAGSWDVTDTLIFESVESHAQQDIFVRITFDEGYTYSNIYLKTWLGANADTLKPVQSEYVLMDLAGKWFADPESETHTFELPVASGNLEPGTRFRVVHSMRDDLLSGIREVCIIQRDRGSE